MTLHVFNPEHDIALASGLSNFTAPHAGRQLRRDLGYLPALWAHEGDRILVDDVELARQRYQHVRRSLCRYLPAQSLPVGTPEFAAFKQAVWSLQTGSLQPANCGIDPWGWDAALCAVLRRGGVPDSLLPTVSQLADIRQLSHRRVAARLLPLLHTEGTVGEAYECTAADEVEALLSRYGRLVLKAPWSSSGRGLRFLDTERNTLQHQAGWLKNMLQLQGSVMAEPYYNKVKDFGMEFRCREGRVEYLGLSLFHTTNGAYSGNILATENTKRAALSRYVSLNLLDTIQADVCSHLQPILANSYEGPFGIDMMIVAGDSHSCNPASFLLHPCVEINLRRTMGHVALSLTPHDDDLQRVMRIHYTDNNYQLKIEKL